MKTLLNEISVQYSKGIGPKRGAVLKSIGIETIEELLEYYPYDYLDRSKILKIAEVKNYIGRGVQVTIVGKIVRHELKRTRNGRKLFFLSIEDETGFLTSLFFAGFNWYQKMFPIGKVVAASAFPELDQFNRPIFIHPEFDRLSSFESLEDDDTTNWEELINTGSLVPKYRSTEKLRSVGLDSRGFRRILHNALANFSSKINETITSEICEKRNLIPIKTAINEIHFPTSNENLIEAEKRLKYEELFFFQLMIQMRKKMRKENWAGIACKADKNLHKKFISSLEFQLTKSQNKCIDEILNDLQQKYPMHRLLHGEVGSGKTVVAICAMVFAIENNLQCAIMVPTEILAEQHFQTLQKLLNNFSIKIELLTGKLNKKTRAKILDVLQNGEIDLIVGTHALLEEDVNFKKLGLIIIDEQHRFGVAQRSLLQTKSKTHAHVLVMTATPIPRTLAMTLYGDLDISVLSELPSKRKKIISAIRTPQEKNKIYSFIRNQIKEGKQAFIVYPIIDESEKIDLKAAITEYEQLSKNIFSDLNLGLLHGRLSSEEKEEVMKNFKNKNLDILVTTTVVEVGIDIPNATVILVEHAERFGLSQLHQLRGRVGRGDAQSYCILMTDFEKKSAKSMSPKSEGEKLVEKQNIKKRLQALVNSNDGFEIAQTDLEIRGQGDYFGYRQSGMPEFKIADIIRDDILLKQANEDATRIVSEKNILSDKLYHEMKMKFENKFRNLLPLTKVG